MSDTRCCATVIGEGGEVRRCKRFGSVPIRTVRFGKLEWLRHCAQHVPVKLPSPGVSR